VNAPQHKRLTGRIAPERIRLTTTPRPPAGAVERFKALGDPTGIVSDAMDELGVPAGIVGAHALRPNITGTKIVGPALTLRNVLQRADPLAGAREGVNRMAEFEAHNLASAGDVLVIQGVAGVSNMGGISAQTGKRQGEAGAIVMGGIRDIAHSRAVGYPLWASEITPITGKWRLETVEINGAIEIAGCASSRAILSSPTTPGSASFRATSSSKCWSAPRPRRRRKRPAARRSTPAFRCPTSRGRATGKRKNNGEIRGRAG
jgi:4-hydroxy-4-methyl-2-oxoglutarate aldolase